MKDGEMLADVLDGDDERAAKKAIDIALFIVTESTNALTWYMACTIEVSRRNAAAAASGRKSPTITSRHGLERSQAFREPPVSSSRSQCGRPESLWKLPNPSPDAIPESYTGMFHVKRCIQGCTWEV